MEAPTGAIRWSVGVDRFRWKLSWVVAFCAAALAAGPPVAGATAGSAASLTDCFWSAVVGGEPPAPNELLPDGHELAWHAWFRLPPGGSVRINAQFPHARSFVYSTFHGLEAYDIRQDWQLAPDPGSLNPFVAGADRTVANRSYTLTITSDSVPGPGQPREQNTIYAGQPIVSLNYRAYLPDQGEDLTGGVGLPAPTYIPPFGPRVSGQAACDAVGSEGNSVPNVFPLLTPEYLALLALKPFSSTHPARPTPHWYALFNVQRAKEPFWAGTWKAPLIPLLPTRLAGPASMNAAFDTRIAYLYIDRTLGPAANGHNVLVLRGRLPTTPATFGGDPVMRSDTQMRYWDICQNTSIPVGRVGDCLYDEQIPTDSDGNYTIIVSLPEDRPPNATARCGVAWLDWGTVGDGLFRPTAGMLYLRNMFPSPSFTQAIQNVIVPGTETEVMGPYLPTANYESPAQFAASGCPGTAHLGAASTPSRD